MELSLSHTLRLFNIFHEYDGKENCAQVLQEEGCVVDINLFLAPLPGRLGKGHSLTPRQLSSFLAPLPGR